MSLHEFGHNLYLVVPRFIPHLGINYRGVTERFSNEFTVGNHSVTTTHEFIIGSKKTLLDFTFRELRSFTFFRILELAVTLEYHALVLIRGMPDLATIKPAAVTADDFAVKSVSL